MAYTFRIPNAIITGHGAHTEVKHLQELHKKTSALFITDNLKIEKEIEQKIIKDLSDLGIRVTEFAEIRDKLSNTVINSAWEAAVEAKADLIVAVGGRFSMHVGRLVAMLLTNGGPIENYTEANDIKTPAATSVVIATTSSSGVAVSTCVCYINATTEKRICFSDPKLLPTVAVLDPGLTNWLSPQDIAQDGMISLGYAVEALASRLATPVTDACALQAVTSMVQWLPEVYSHSHEMEMRERLMSAQQLVAMSSANVMANMICKLAGQIEYRTHIPMGSVVAALLPNVIELLEEKIPDKMRLMAKAIHHSDDTLMEGEQLSAADEFRSIIKRLDMPLQLSFLGLEEFMLEELVESLEDRTLATEAPIPTGRKAILNLLRTSL